MTNTKTKDEIRIVKMCPQCRKRIFDKLKEMIFVCSKSNLNSILSKIAEVAKNTFGNNLQAVILYGSYARGDYDDASDIDIMIIADVDREDLFRYKKPIIKATSELGLENDVVITATLKDKKTFEQYKNALPFYQSVLREGVKVAV